MFCLHVQQQRYRIAYTLVRVHSSFPIVFIHQTAAVAAERNASSTKYIPMHSRATSQSPLVVMLIMIM